MQLQVFHLLHRQGTVHLPENNQPLIEGEDYVMEGPYLVFTAAYHLKRGYCCKSGCKNCPWRIEAAGIIADNPQNGSRSV